MGKGEATSSQPIRQRKPLPADGIDFGTDPIPVRHTLSDGVLATEAIDPAHSTLHIS